MDRIFLEKCSLLIKDYLAFNHTGDVSDSTLWGAFKVVIRSFVLSYKAKKQIKKTEKTKVISYRYPTCPTSKTVLRGLISIFIEGDCSFKT